jgi:hypothetical protein
MILCMSARWYRVGIIHSLCELLIVVVHIYLGRSEFFYEDCIWTVEGPNPILPILMVESDLYPYDLHVAYFFALSFLSSTDVLPLFENNCRIFIEIHISHISIRLLVFITDTYESS